MPVATGTALAIAAGAGVLGGIAGSQPTETTQDSSGKSKTWMDLANASGLEKYGKKLTTQELKQLQALGAAGPGMADVTAGSQAQRDLAAAFQQAAASGGLPTGADVTAAQGAINPLFEARRVAMSQAFGDQQINANRAAVAMGRDINDPILQAKLAQEQTRQQALLGAEQQGAAQQLALGLPGQRLQYLQQGASALQGLSDQAWRNRAALMQAGQSVLGMERGFRLDTAKRYEKHSGVTSQQSGGGFGGAVGGALGAAGGAFGLVNQANFASAFNPKVGGDTGGGLSMPTFGSQFQGQAPSLGTNLQYPKPSFPF